ncbi:MAG: GGDEF domain-containing protein, partial [Pseudomonadota bacterium]
LNSSGGSVPKVASVRRMPNGNLVWIFLEAENRNSLFHELESARHALQEQREQLELLALTDPLTGLSNRRDFENKGRHIFATARRSGRPVSVLMLDVDRFKALNDTYGHDAGDRALCVLADVLKSTCRESDSVARLGGDEFACLLSDTDFADATLLRDRIRIAVEETDNLEVTVSIGIAEMADDAQIDLYELLKRADEALYSAKRAGRDRTPAMVGSEPRWSVGGQPLSH